MRFLTATRSLGSSFFDHSQSQPQISTDLHRITQTSRTAIEKPREILCNLVVQDLDPLSHFLKGFYWSSFLTSPELRHRNVNTKRLGRTENRKGLTGQIESSSIGLRPSLEGEQLDGLLRCGDGHNFLHLEYALSTCAAHGGLVSIQQGGVYVLA